MFWLLIISILCEELVVGGKPGYVPYMVSIFLHDEFVCGGVIVDSKKVITTATCLQEVLGQALFVRSGSATVNQGGSVTGVDGMRIHEKYNENSLDYDIAYVYIRENATFDPSSYPLRLATAEPQLGMRMNVSGWGMTEMDGRFPDDLHTSEMTVMGKKECQTYYNNKYDITERLMCAVSESGGPCFGDGGSALAADGVLYGIAINGWSCEEKGKPTVFTDISSKDIRDFIES